MVHDRSTARRLLIRRLVRDHRISSQRELSNFLHEAGHHVSQSTISRDLTDLGATRQSDELGHTRYLIETTSPSTTDRDHVRRVLEEYLEQAIPSSNLVVLKVQAASAGTVAAAIDTAPLPGVIGTIAGDDTVLVIAGTPNGGGEVATEILDILEV
jgi:transcriptional regulator of arginine metabolism